MRHYLLAGVRRRPGVAPRPHGPYATALLPPEEAALLGDTTRAALALLGAGGWTPVRSRDRFVLDVFDGVGVHRLVEAPQQVHGEGPVPALFKLVWHVDAPALGAAAALAELCDLIAGARHEPDGPDGLDGHGFLVALGRQAAGITPGRRGWADLAVGGHNLLLGDGFRAHLDDGSHRQVRHFAGTAAATDRLGARTTRVLSRLRGDLPGTPDDHLSHAAVDFAQQLRTGRLTPDRAGAWVREHLVAG